MDDNSTPMIPPKDWGLVDPEGFAAFELLQTFKTHSTEDGELSHTGYFTMQQIFDRVEPENRASVFVQFLGQLDASGLEYDKSQFNAESVEPGDVRMDG